MSTLNQNNTSQDDQYSKNGIITYEWIFGQSCVSTGGRENMEKIVALLKLKEGHRVLDVGCGLGGHDFFMAENYGAIIDAVDLSENMLAIATDYLSKKTNIANKIKFQLCDVTTTQFEHNFYDAIYSRDALMHIQNKDALFEKFFKLLKPGGRIVFTDYGRWTSGESSDEFNTYVKERGYNLLTVSQYEELMLKVGFINVSAQDKTEEFANFLEQELQKLYDKKEEFLQNFTIDDFKRLESGWLSKIKRAKVGEQTWLVCQAEKEA